MWSSCGVIGLELGQSLHRLGVETRLFGRDHSVGPLSDPDVRERAATCLGADFPVIWHADTDIRREGEQVVIARNGEQAAGEARIDWLLAATGRRANIDALGLETTPAHLARHRVLGPADRDGGRKPSRADRA